MFTLIQNADVYAPEPLGRRDILICGGQIVAVQPSIQFTWPGLRTIDAAGRRLIPGLIDQHVHITGGGGESSFKSRAPEVQLEDCLASGVTTVVGMLGTDARTRSVANVVAKAKALNEEGITAYCLTGAYAYPSPTLTGSVGDDIAYINEIIGVKIAISDHRSSNMSAEELARLVSEVRQAALISGKVGEVHMHMGVGKQGLNMIFQILEETEIPIKHFRPTHMQKALAHGIRFANMGGYIDFTSGDPVQAASALAKAAAQAPFDRITLSSDSNGSMPRWNENNEVVGMDVASMTTLFDCVKELVLTHDMPLEQALLPVTKTVATALEIYPQKGCIAEGSDADLILLSEDLSFDLVMAKGRTDLKRYYA